MKNKLFGIVAFIVLLSACNKTNDLQKTGAYEASDANAKFKAEPINFTAPNVFPEGMVYDPIKERFLVSSISMGTIGAVSPKGVYSPFIQDADLVSTAGMKIDKERKRLLVTNSSADGTVAQLAVYDLKTGSRIFLTDLLAVANDGAPHLANDVAIDEKGNAYVTDSYAGIIYKVKDNGKAKIFYKNTAYTPAPGAFGFNGIEYCNNKGGYLLVAHSAFNQVIKIPLNNPDAVSNVQLDASIVSPDGLLLSKNGKQLIIVNNTAIEPGSKVMSFETKNNWTDGSNTHTFETGVVYPTTLTSDGKTEYVLYSYLHLLFGGQQQEIFTIQPLPFTCNSPF